MITYPPEMLPSPDEGQEAEVVSLGEALPKQMARVRDEVMPSYIEIGQPGQFALAMMRNSLDRATKALAEGDVVQMIRAYEELISFKD
jgi:hypothetical protein